VTHTKNGWYLPALLVLASCSSDESGPSRDVEHDVAYYIEHDEEREEMNEKCDDHLLRYMEAEKDLELYEEPINCDSARTAGESIILFGRSRDSNK